MRQDRLEPLALAHPASRTVRGRAFISVPAGFVAMMFYESYASADRDVLR
jgi:hypothetical protein